MGTRVGDVLASKYRLEELLGSGGMGHVYRAVNVEIERAVAIKVLRSEHATNAPIVERFLREARAANLVRHPNVVDVVDIGRDGDGSPFIVQELLKGEDLSKYIERRGGQLTIAEIEEYLLPVVDAVAEAHAQGVVHRDIKPENVFLAEQGRKRIPKLLDFGISKVRLPNIKLTEVGVMMGTPAYMAPEQIQGSREADPRTDVWALGIMLFELLSGRLPFEAEDAPALFVAVATKDVPRLVDVCPDVPPDVSTIVERCLRRPPDERYPSALELARDLRHVFEGAAVEPTQARSLPAHLLARRSPQLDIPDLVVPAKRQAEVERPPAPKTLSGSPPSLALNKTELSVPAQPSFNRSSVPDAPPLGPVSSPRQATPPSGRTQPQPAPHSQPQPYSQPRSQPQPAPHSQPHSQPQSYSQPRSQPQPYSQPRVEAPPAVSGAGSGRRVDEPLAGVMLAGPSASSHRRPPPASAYMPDLRPPPPVAGPDTALLVGLAVIGLTSIGATAILMTMAYQPEGWPIVGFVTKPTPTTNLAVQGGLAVVALILAARSALSGLKKWRGDITGGRGAAVVSAIVAGGLFFAALQLARAAW